MNSYYEIIYAHKKVSWNFNLRSLIGNIPGCFPGVLSCNIISCNMFYHVDFSLERGFDNSHQTIVPIAIVVLKKRGPNPRPFFNV